MAGKWEMENGWRVLVIGEMTVARGGTKDPGIYLVQKYNEFTAYFLTPHDILNQFENSSGLVLHISLFKFF